MDAFGKTAIDGTTFVLVPEDAFEDMIDLIVAKEIEARVEGGEESWPASLVYELWETDSRIRTLRSYRNMTVFELSEAAGISQPYLSEIESGKKAGSTEALARIAEALRVDVEDLMA